MRGFGDFSLMTKRRGSVSPFLRIRPIAKDRLKGLNHESCGTISRHAGDEWTQVTLPAPFALAIRLHRKRGSLPVRSPSGYASLREAKVVVQPHWAPSGLCHM